MSDPSDDEVDRLLARGSLSGRQREKILQSVLQTTVARPRQARRWWVWGGGSGLVLAAAAAAVLLWPRVADRDQREFRTKGSAPTGTRIEMSCLGAQLKACPRGSLVGFAVEALARNVLDGGSFVTAYADPASPGERIWYLTNQPVSGPLPDRPESSRVVDTAARIGAEHAPGLYRVEVVLSRRPLSRDEAVSPAAADVVAHGRFNLKVIP